MQDNQIKHLTGYSWNTFMFHILKNNSVMYIISLYPFSIFWLIVTYQLSLVISLCNPLLGCCYLAESWNMNEMKSCDSF